MRKVFLFGQSIETQAIEDAANDLCEWRFHFQKAKIKESIITERKHGTFIDIGEGFFLFADDALRGCLAHRHGDLCRLWCWHGAKHDADIITGTNNRLIKLQVIWTNPATTFFWELWLNIDKVWLNTCAPENGARMNGGAARGEERVWFKFLYRFTEDEFDALLAQFIRREMNGTAIKAWQNRWRALHDIKMRIRSDTAPLLAKR